MAKDIGPIGMLRRGCASGTGATVEKADLEALLPWLEWAFATAKAKLAKAA